MDTYLRVATFNLKSSLIAFGERRWKYRRELIFRMFRELDADVAGVQELTPSMRRDFVSNLAGWRLFGVGRGGALFDEHADIAVKEGLHAKLLKTFWLTRRPDRSSRLVTPRSPLSWIFPRICTVAEITKNGRRIRVFNTHLDLMSDAARYIELRIICRQISAYQEHDPLPTLLCGDFNAKPDSRSIKELADNGCGYENVRLYNLSEGIGGTYHFYRGGEGSRSIDYIFASKDFQLSDFEVIRSSYDGLYPSDHYPLIASLRLTD